MTRPAAVDGNAPKRGRQAAASSSSSNDGVGEGARGVGRFQWLRSIEPIKKYRNGDVYEGELKYGRPHGKGVYKYANGNVYDGDWRDGLMSGRGTMTRANGDVYEGEWKNGARHGQGTYKWENGDVHKGEWVKGNQHGSGTTKYSSGETYEGAFEGGKRHGWGALTRANGDVYVGEFVGGGQHGGGSLKWKNGDIYQGDFAGGKRHGWGTMIWAAGDWYEGQWANGKHHGNGTKQFSSGSMYEGNWEDGMPKGKGRWSSRDTSACRDTPLGSNARGDLAGRPGSPLGCGVVTTLDAPQAAKDTSTKNTRVYNERQVRSQRSQQRRLQTAKKTCENCGVDDYQYKLRMCSACGVALYCSAACQKSARGSHQRICEMFPELPHRDSDRLVLKYDGEKMVDLDAGLRYATKYMDKMKHLAINLCGIGKGDTVKLSAKQLSSLLDQKKGALESVFWTSVSQGYGVPNVFPGITRNGHVWKELHGLKQLRLERMQFDDVQLAHDIISQQKNTLAMLCLPYLDIGWSKAKCRRTFAQAVNSCKNLVKLDLNCCLLMDSDLKIMLQDMPIYASST